MKLKKATLYIAGIIVLVAFAGIFFFSNSGSTTGNVISNPSNGEAQNVVLSVKNLNYYPNTITVKANQPVKIKLDDSVAGCLRSFAIRELGIQKYLKTPQETLEFTPTEKGTYRFSCSMGMGYGTLIVE